ncbi:GNAT family N-acetyltransferase [Dyadobacter arcticus]|uniref:Ribosomal-protein-alanine N-acetyltransferase n=1 Tax=Dyadobacter arcticus TaxID=1078754 RepID=A0ABX0UJD9_9BACT|nr:GNAT family N-acetyltransferase [Dyadobacter arcticus]NIJ53123.1 ribosomal-protein-alanine N-acetyltransferase [Dyadobacter arcticus]
MKKEFHPFPEIETERLYLHALRAQEAQNMYLLRSNQQAMEFIGKPLLRSVEEAEELIYGYQRNLKELIGITWSVSRKASSGLIGTIGFHKIDWPNHRAEIGYMLHPDYWGKGFMIEAVGAVLNYGFDQIGLHSVEAKIHPNNGVSRNLLIKFQFLKEGYFRENFFDNGIFWDTEVYSLLKSGYLEK